MSKQPMNRSRGELLVVLDVNRQTERVTKLVRTMFLALVAALVLILALTGLNQPIFRVTNDYEYTLNITGSMLINGLIIDGIQLTTFNPLALLAYIGVGVALAGTAAFIIANACHAIRAIGTQESLVLSGKLRKVLKYVIGISATAAAMLFLLFEPVYKLTQTAEGGEYMTKLAENYAFNCNPTATGTLLMLGCFFVGTYYLCSAASTTKFWKRHQGGCYLLGLVALLLYFWQYGYLHALFGIDPSTASFPYPFPRAINSFSKFTGSVKGSYNSVFGALVKCFFTTTSTTLNDSMIYNATTTVAGMLIGFVLGGVLGYAVSLLAACCKRWGAGVLTICSILAAFPVVALGPIVNHWFPSNSVSGSLAAKIIVVTILCMAGMAVNAYKGLTVLKPFAMDLMDICDANAKQSFFMLRLPNSLPNVFTALKINSATALMGSFVCEFYSRSKTFGIGMMFNNYWDVARYQSWAYIIVAILFGLILYLIVAAVEKRCIAWHPSMRKKR
jgi:NitT/TauT family transport system permease protein